MAKIKYKSNASDSAGCAVSGGCFLVFLVFNLCFGAWSVNYCLDSFLGKTVDFWIAMVTGLILAEITVPLAVICWLLRLAGLDVPFIH